MKALGIILVVALIVLIGWAGLEITLEVMALYHAADPNLRLGVMTAGGSALAFVINNAIQSSRERRARLFEAKREAYGEFFKAFMSFFHRLAQGQEVPQQEMIAAIQGLSTNIMTWGGASAVNAFNKYQRSNAVPTEDNMELFRRTELFLRALRKDLGHSDSFLEAYALTKLNLKGEEHGNLG